MLFRNTILYLPAQLLPALFQFAQLIAWSHLTSARTIGVITLFVSIHDMLIIALLSFWNQYTTRYSAELSKDEESRRRLRNVATALMGGSVVLQISLALLIYVLAIDSRMSLLLAIVIAALVGGRAINLFQAERARARHDILGYSVAVMSGPVVGCLLGLLFLWYFDGDAFWVFLGFALAQLVGMAFGFMRDREWIGLGRPDMSVIRHAIGYGGPIIVSGVLNWLSQNVGRLVVSYLFGFGAVGIYSLGMGLGYRASTVAAMMVTAAAFPLAVRQANAGDLAGARRQLSANGALLVGILAVSMAGLAVVSRDILDLLVSDEMSEPARPVMLWSILAGTLICVRSHFLNQIFLLQSNTRPIATVAIIDAAVAVVLTAIIVPLSGPVGGAMALAGTSATSLLITGFMARKAGLMMPLAHLAKIAVATAAMVVILLIFPSSSNVWRLAERVAAGGATYFLVLAGLYQGELRRWLSNRRTRAGL